MSRLREELVTACFVEKYSVMMQLPISLRRRCISLDERSQSTGTSKFYQPKVSTLNHLRAAIRQSGELVPSYTREANLKGRKFGEDHRQSRIAARHDEFAVFILTGIKFWQFDDEFGRHKCLPEGNNRLAEKGCFPRCGASIVAHNL